MSLFKVSRGSEANLPTQKTDGWAYFCTDTGSFWIDHLDSNNTLVRSKISANFADKLRYIADGETVELNPSEIATHTYVETQLGNVLLNSQADWNENDETSYSYIKNRTHYECTEMVAIVPEQSLEFISGNPEYIYDVENLVAGETYTVFFNGTEYICVAYTTGYQDELAIGNGALVDLNGGNSEPFFAAVFDGEMIVFAEEGTHTLSVKKSVESIVTIDEKFIPDSIKIGRMGTAIGAEVFNDYTNNEASGIYTHAEGYNTTASARYAHAEGENTEASGYSSHAEGLNTVAMGNWSHAEGDSTTASGSTSHAEGVGTTASGDYSHAEGSYTVASAQDAHAEGQCTVAAARWSHAEGNGTNASALGQHVQGEYNIVDTEGSIYERGRYAHIVGNGTYEKRSNAHTLDWDGNAWFAGDIYVGGTSQDDAVRLARFDEVPDGVVVDPSLTMENQAAEAKATGEAISQIQTDVDNVANNKVDKVTGKGLSTNDYTTAEKNKLADIEDGANNYVLPNATDSVVGGMKLYGSTGTNTVGTMTQKAITDALDGKSEAGHNHDSVYSKLGHTHTAADVGAATETYVDNQVQGAKSYTDTKVAGLVDSSPETLNTLNELAAALGDDPNFATTMANELGTKATKTELSTHASSNLHITSAERTNWNAAKTHADSVHAPSNAERNVIVGVQKNGTDVSVDSNRKINITVPTKTSELTNNSDFATNAFVTSVRDALQANIDNIPAITTAEIDEICGASIYAASEVEV